MLHTGHTISYAKHLLYIHDCIEEEVSVEVLLQAQLTAHQFVAYWRREQHCFDACAETKFIVDKCHVLLRKHNNTLDVLYGKIRQGGVVCGYSLFVLSRSIFKEKTN